MMMNKGRNSHVDGGSMSDASEESSAFDLRRGPWTLEEDNLLIHYITCHGEGRWNTLAKCAGLKRTGKSCRLRWLNYLKPDIKRGNLTAQEQLLILELHSKWGNRWSKIAQHLPGRTDNEIKNYWRTRVQKQARQLNVDSNSRKFLEAIRGYWMPRLVEKMEQKNYSSLSSSSSSFSSHSSTDNNNHHFTGPPSSLLKNHSHSQAQVPPFAISSSPKNYQDHQKEKLVHLLMANSTANKGSSSDSLRKMQVTKADDDDEIVENPTSSCPVQTFDYDVNTIRDGCYHVDMTGYNLEEGFEMSAMESHGDINDLSEYHEIAEADLFNGDNMSSGSSLWNLDDLWHLRKSEVGI